ncbi:DUF1330 domain-containing protein [Nocardia sp. CDC159]|uniref:DUF1330 domain-containing protein n=1 Tax=Nocardia pulmonis TaxID=2951408 RepID=A0A9X2J063_9NOCA|nr:MULTISPECIES: DUF1330 domain-containing protein [Nocardia]MCM6776755.1 DUF1330 domain-containing protein [Nocardia pulmonis]MCM6789096.1 DUF1330 domain-containing protein [Nocardia sp. CDC159]
MSVYVVVDAVVLDGERAGEYRRLAEATIERHGGRYLVQGVEPQAVEGQWPADRSMTVVEFPDRTSVERWYSSAEYQRAVRVRDGAIDVRLLFVKGERAA